jgi:CRISPR-associated protein Csb1
MLDLESLKSENRILFAVKLKPVLGDRFQPTGFPSLGAAQYKTSSGQKLIVESAQSMANRLEITCWDTANNSPVADLQGISHVSVSRGGTFLTDSMLESHRINSPYLLECKSDKTFIETLKKELGGLEFGPVDRKRLAETLFKYDIGSLIHGVFLAKSELAGGRLRIARALSAFIEASRVEVAASGGVKNDHVNPSGDTKSGFGNVPFARDEYVAEEITCFINLDLAQIRGYGLDSKATDLVVLLSLYRIRKLLDGDMRLRTACDLEPIDKSDVSAMRPIGFYLPSLGVLSTQVRSAIAACKDRMLHTTVKFEDKMEKAKETKESSESDGDDDQGDI